MLLLRQLQANDTQFIYDSWLKAIRHSNKNDHLINDVYYPEQRKRIEEILSIADVIIACNEQDQDQIFGYIVFKKPNILYYGHVKGPFRRMGIFNTMMQAAFKVQLEKQQKLYTENPTKLARAIRPKYNFVFKEKIK